VIPKTEAEIQNLKKSGRMLAQVLAILRKAAKVGVTTAELDSLAAKELVKLGGKPAFLGYRGFPAVLCISINDEVVHGIPGDRKLEEGDIVGLDFGVDYEGMITDSAITVEIGKVSKDAHRLVKATEEALMIGIDQVRAGVHIGDIGAAIEARLRKDKLGVIEDLAGHGVGHELHEEPWVPNFGTVGRGPVLREGMTIAIEPMATLGTHEVVWGIDGWTISTGDGSLGAHFEHTVLVTKDGAEILTQ
jgi:methionyl aminopeptidase